jgi:hypothetical protein
MSNPEAALKAEAAGNTADVEFKGETFTIPLEYDDFPLSYIEAAVDGRPLAVQARELLGAEQWERVRALNLTGRGLQELSDAISDAAGLDSGNSPASSD